MAGSTVRVVPLLDLFVPPLFTFPRLFELIGRGAGCSRFTFFGSVFVAGRVVSIFFPLVLPLLLIVSVFPGSILPFVPFAD